jgi:hypothetical protein
MIKIAALRPDFRGCQVYRTTDHAGLVDKIAKVPILQLWIPRTKTRFWLKARPEGCLHTPIRTRVDGVQAEISEEWLNVLPPDAAPAVSADGAGPALPAHDEF